MKDILVAKFGGTSVNSKATINALCNIVTKESKKAHVVVVVSALRGITDLLLTLDRNDANQEIKVLSEIKRIHSNLAEEVFTKKEAVSEIELYVDSIISKLKLHLRTKKADEKWMDKTVSYGEMFSSFIIARALREKDIPAQQVISTEIVVTDDNFGSAEFLPAETKEKTIKKIFPLIKKRIVPVVTGFLGATKSGETTTLGRGGSDYSAAILGYVLSAKEVQIWTDVNGIYTADPRIVKNAAHVVQVSYREASEMAFFGAKVLHPRTIHPAVKAAIPVRVLNTANPNFSGTVILKKGTGTQIITAITSKRDVPLVNIYATEMLLSKGFLKKVFGIFAKHNISIDLVSVSEVSVSLTLDNEEQLEKAIFELQKFSRTNIIKNVSIISLIGERISADPEILSLIFSVLYKRGIGVKMISFSTTNTNISLVVDMDQETKAVQTLHDEVLLKKFKGGEIK